MSGDVSWTLVEEGLPAGTSELVWWLVTVEQDGVLSTNLACLMHDGRWFTIDQVDIADQRARVVAWAPRPAPFNPAPPLEEA